LRQRDGNPFERALLEAGAGETPSGHSRQRAWVAFAAGMASVASTGALGAAAVGSAGTSTLALVVKWVGIGVLAGAAGAGGAATVFHSTHSGPAHEATAAASAGPATPSTLAAPATPRQIEIGPAAAVASGSRGVVRPGGQTGIELEVTLLEQARASLAAGDTARSADLLDQHRRLADRLLAPEAELLAIELSLIRGDRRQAAAAARAFLAANPRSPHAQRARSLLGRAEPDGGIPSSENGH
jgi:hypothetical protein